VAERYRAGESILVLAKDYGLELEQIEDAIRCETRGQGDPSQQARAGGPIGRGCRVLHARPGRHLCRPNGGRVSRCSSPTARVLRRFEVPLAASVTVTGHVSLLMAGGRLLDPPRHLK
jgi:hypothetical protein